MSTPMEPEEGQQVSYVGPGWRMPAQGRLLAITGSSGHVKWDSGDDAGRITLTALEDLLPVGSFSHAAAVTDAWSDSLDVADGLSTEAALDGVISDDEFLFGVSDDL